jgi:hypothetical protein
LGDISGKPDNFEKARSVEQSRGDAVGDLTPRSSLKGSNNLIRELGAADPKKPIKVPKINTEKMQNFTNLKNVTDWKQLTAAAVKNAGVKDAEELYTKMPHLFQKPTGKGKHRGPGTPK